VDECHSISTMRLLCFLALSLTAMLPGFAQTAANAGPGLPKEPREVFAAAAPFYDYSDPTLKPWHLKATYQLYDEKGDPGEQGTYEYWWASPQVYRSTWTRQGTTHTNWHTADGKYAHQDMGVVPLEFFEYRLESALLSPLPKSSEMDMAKYNLDRESIGSKDAKFPCIMLVPQMPQRLQIKTVPLGLFPTYCFNSQLPVLRASYSFGNTATTYDNIAKFQNKYIAREISFLDGKRKILSAKVESITSLDPSDPALTPPITAPTSKLDKVKIAGGMMVGMVLEKPSPVYPQDAKDARVSGTVVMQAVIGRDGRIHDLRVLSAPWPSMAASALSAVSHWRYKPYLLNGAPVEVDTTINVVFSLGG